MKIIILSAFALLSLSVQAQKADSNVYELRIYKAANGKREKLTDLVRVHTQKMLQKHDMRLIGFWTDADSNQVIYLAKHKTRDAINASVQDLYGDVQWPSIKENLTDVGGARLSVRSISLQGADVLPAIKNGNAIAPGAIFELRVYTCYPGKLPDLVNRFKTKTDILFARHHLEVNAYWKTIEADNRQPNLVYIVSHKDKESQKANWKEFQADPEWNSFRNESEKNGKIVENVKVVNMIPATFPKR